jgi:hypothetical protein
VQGSYAGAKPDRARPSTAGGAPATRDVPKAKPATRDVQRPQQPSTRDVKRPPTSGGDRGYSKPAASAKPAARPQQATRQAPSRGGGVSPSRGGQAERAASQRGKQSMPQGARSKGGGGGGGGKQRR